jgi:RNA polymerase sigma-70 factor (ECF subfamily)
LTWSATTDVSTPARRRVDRVLAGEEFHSPTGADFGRMLTGARAGEEWAFTVLFRTWHPLLLRYLLGRAPSVAEDLAAEVWMAVARRLRDFEGGEKEWRAWLFTLAHRRLVDHQRAAGRRRTDPAPPDAFSEQSAPDDPAQETTERFSSQAAVETLVSSLSPEQAEVVLLRVVAGLDSAQVAQIMGRSAGWVRVNQHRALQRMTEQDWSGRGDSGG